MKIHERKSIEWRLNEYNFDMSNTRTLNQIQTILESEWWDSIVNNIEKLKTIISFGYGNGDSNGKLHKIYN